MTYKKIIALALITALLAMLVGRSKLNGHNTDESGNRASSMTGNAQSMNISEYPVWKGLYADELNRHIDSCSPKFNICDLDGDGMPELLISDESCHAACGGIFTVYTGKLYDLGNYGSWGEFQYDPVSKYILAGFTGQGETYGNVYKLENSKIVEIISFHEDPGTVSDKYKRKFEIDGKPVTKVAYQNELAKYTSDNYESPFVRKYDITASEISRVIDDYFLLAPF